MRALSIALVSGLALIASSALAKPLYITVPRSYAPSESPVVDVAFEDREPVELRILKPADLDGFIAGQSNLRRAYEAPPLTVNPGRYLTRGLNAVKSPGDFLLYALDPDLRSSVSDALPPPPAASSAPISKMREGAVKLVGIPPGMTLVTSRWLNLDLGGSERDFNVPGFEEWGGSSGYQERRVTLDPLPAGVYVLQMVQGRIEGQVVLVVTDQTVQVKQTSGKLLVRVAGRDQKPKPGVAVSVFLPKGKGPSGTTDAKGEALLPIDDPKILVEAKSGTDAALVDTDFYSTLSITPDVFLYTDRPIYRPGDNVQFRGLIRKPDSVLAQLFKPKKHSVTVRLETEGTRDEDDSGHAKTPPAASITAELDEFGCFHGSLAVPDGLPTGVLRVVAEVDAHDDQAEARVQEYVKPTFYVEVSSDQENAEPGGQITATVKARRYSGGVPEKTAYEVFLYRTVLDTPSWVDDSGMGGKGSAVTYGSLSTTEGALSVPKRLYSSVEERMKANGGEGGEDSWSTAPTFDEKTGEAKITITVPPLDPDEERIPFRYSLSVRARDDQGTFANASKGFFFADSDVMGALKPSQKVTLANGKVQLAVRATTLSGKPFGQADGTVEWVLRDASGGESTISTEKLHTGIESVWRGNVPTKGVGTVVARVTLLDAKQRPWKGETSVMVAGEHGEPVAHVASLSADAVEGILEPGDEAQVVALLPDGWGPGGAAKGPVWVTLEGTTIFRTDVVDVSGSTLIRKFPVERRFGSAVYASIAYPTSSGRWEERVIPFRIVPSERTLSVSIAPKAAEAAPLGKQTIDVQVSDWKGHGEVSQLSVGVVDKAIYALQAEFRPGILSFFYPLVRDNVSSYQSAEFQGYGYGELLARAAGRIHGYEFAAIKPPTKKQQNQEKDTAYWNPSVTTDADGHASVTFDLPSNQTLWTVTVVAADASGRFGENTAEFATRGAFTLVSSVPQFLRQGDKATGSVRLSRGTKGGGGNDPTLTVTSASVGDAVALTSAPATIDKMAQGTEKVVPFQLAAANVADGRVQVTVTGGPETLVDRRDIPVMPAAIEDTVRVSSLGGGKLDLDLPKSAQVETVELSLGASSVEMTLANLTDLLEYPYGCLEQLNATTIPNIAVYSTLEKVGAVDKLDPDSKALLAEARSRATQGIDRILSLEVKGGGFVLWPGQSTPEVPLTLIALDGMAYAVDAGLVSPDEPRVTDSAAWLGNQGELPFEEDATRAYVLARLQGPKAAPRVRALVDKVPPGDWYGIALTVLAAEQAGVASEPAIRGKVDSMIEQAAGGLVQLASYHPTDEEFFWDYPLREVGMTAVLAHAASFGKADAATLRAKLVDVMSRNADLSTFDRSTFLLHSLWLLEKDARDMRSMTAPSVSADGPVSFSPRGAGLVASLDPSNRGVKVGSFEGIATLKAKVRIPAADVQPAAEGMSLDRKYFVLRNDKKVELKSGDAVAQGEEVFVQFTLDARAGDRWRSLRSAYYVLEDAVPAGFVPLTEDKAWRGAPYNLPMEHTALKRRALSPERADFFFEEPAWWSDSPRTVGYVIRAQFPGTFVAPPATLEDMYAKAVHARTAAFQLGVSAPK